MKNDLRSASPPAGVQLLPVREFSDERGAFMETYAADRFQAIGIDNLFVQDNLSRSRRGVLRGLHSDPRMSKLVQVIRGEVYDVVVDLREQSPSHLHWFGLHLRAQEPQQLYIPCGFLHGFLALTDEVIFSYKQSARYDPSQEFGVAWNDPDLQIAWPLSGQAPLLSPKDAQNPTLRELGLWRTP